MPPKDKKGNKQPAKDKSPLLQSKKSNVDTESVRTGSGLSLETENQFEVELCWCIQQLQLTLSDGKIVGRQAMDVKKSLNALQSNNTSLIRKRQIMRNTLGDYRKKMVEDERKFGKTAHSVKFTCQPPSKSTKSAFFKKAQTGSVLNDICNPTNHQLNDIVQHKDINKAESEKDSPSSTAFKFNFVTSD